MPKVGIQLANSTAQHSISLATICYATFWEPYYTILETLPDGQVAKIPSMLSHIAKGAIYLYFPSKEALFETALKERLVDTRGNAKAMAQGVDGSNEELMLLFFEKARTEMVEGRAFTFLKILLAEDHRFPDLVTRYKDVVLRPGLEAVRGLLRRGVERKELRPEAADIEPRLVTAPTILLTLWGTVFQGVPAPDAHEVWKQHVAILLRSLGADRRPESHCSANGRSHSLTLPANERSAPSYTGCWAEKTGRFGLEPAICCDSHERLVWTESVDFPQMQEKV